MARAQKLKAGEQAEIVNCAHIRLGDVNNNSKRESYVLLRCKIIHLKICSTRLTDKAERVLVLQAVKELGAEVVSSAQEASVVVTSSYSTTMKCLTALVLGKTLVGPSFLQVREWCVCVCVYVCICMSSTGLHTNNDWPTFLQHTSCMFLPSSSHVPPPTQTLSQWRQQTAGVVPRQ